MQNKSTKQSLSTQASVTQEIVSKGYKDPSVFKMEADNKKVAKNCHSKDKSLKESKKPNDLKE